MPNSKQYRAAEEELMKGLSGSIHRERNSGAGHPHYRELRQFATGKHANDFRTEKIYAHLADCDGCIGTMAQIRRRAKFARRAVLLSSVLIVLAVLSIWTLRVGKRADTVVALDLRSLSVTRGVQQSTNNSLSLPRGARQLKIILPVGSEGRYQIEILDQSRDGSAVFSVFGEAQRQGEGVSIELPIDWSKFVSGRYRLALRRDGADWEYYPLTVK